MIKASDCIIIMFFLLCLISCDKEEVVTPKDAISIKTLEVTDISEQGALFSAEINYRGDFEIIEYGFEWNCRYPNLNNCLGRKSFIGNIQDNKFSKFIDTSLPVGDISVNCFIKTKELLIVGNKVRFISQGSSGVKLIEFSPESAKWNDTVYLRGEGFNYYSSKNTVLFGSEKAVVLSASDTLLVVTVPQSLDAIKCNITVEANSFISSFGNQFTLE